MSAMGEFVGKATRAIPAPPPPCPVGRGEWPEEPFALLGECPPLEEAPPWDGSPLPGTIGCGRDVGLIVHALHHARILIVDDDPQCVWVLKHLLYQGGYCLVHHTTDSTAVMALHRQHAYDLILLDMVMPRLGGTELLEQLQEEIRRHFLPVVAMTTSLDEELKLQALALGAQDFIHKPYHPQEVLNRIRNLLAVRMMHVDLQRRVEERTRALEESRLEVIHRLSRAAEFRDHGTGSHLQRMSRYAAALALAGGGSRELADLILTAAPMHDIGKIGIPDRIVLKPGPLTSEESRTMQAHTTIGAGMLEGAVDEPLRTAGVIALTHHERWDGTGYPQGLKGEGIPLAGRICAIADVFDALTSHRPYRGARSLEEGLLEMERGAGSRFDPVLIRALTTIVPTLREIRRRFHDE